MAAGCEEIRLRLKREAVKDLNRKRTEFRKTLERLAEQRKAYRQRMRAVHGKKWKKSKRGKKPQRLNTRFEPPRLENGETLVEALTRCSRQLSMSREKWSATQEKRAKILFALYSKLEEAYRHINSLRAIFRNRNLTKETAATNFNGETVLMTATSAVIPNNVYHIKLVIADRNDTSYDSAVFLGAGSFDIGTADIVGTGQFDGLPDLSGPNAVCGSETVTIQAGPSPIFGATYE